MPILRLSAGGCTPTKSAQMSRAIMRGLLRLPVKEAEMLYGLREYHRPTTLEEALHLLQRTDIRTVPLAGGTELIGRGGAEIEAVVDLSALGLDFIERKGNTLRLGAMVRLQTIVERLREVADGLLAEAARRMAGWNIRNMATLGGSLVGGGPHTPLSVSLAALGARLAITGQDEPLSWPIDEIPQGQLIATVVTDLPEGAVGAGYEQVGRTPADHPIVCAAAVASCSDGGTIHTRTAVGGLLARGLMVVDQAVADDIPAAVEAVAAQIIPPSLPEMACLSDYRGSAEYRRAVAPVVARRALTTAIERLA